MIQSGFYGNIQNTKELAKHFDMAMYQAQIKKTILHKKGK